MNQKDGGQAAGAGPTADIPDDVLLDQTMRRCVARIEHAAAQASRSHQLRLLCEIALPVLMAALVCAFTPGLVPGAWRIVCGGVAAVTLAVIVVFAVSAVRLSRDAHQDVRKIAEEFESEPG